MDQKLSRSDVERHLNTVTKALPRADCRTCECFQGFVTQLSLDATDDVSDLIDRLQVPAERVHGCLGCDPCPPGDEFADYLRPSCC